MNASCSKLRRLGRAGSKSFILLVLICVAGASDAAAQAVRVNAGFRQSSLPRNDDSSTFTAVPLGFGVNFFGQSFDAAFVNNNGNMTFGLPLDEYTPAGLGALPFRIIAPFWADVDTTGANSSVVTYGRDTVNGMQAFGVNWINVGYFLSRDDKLNSFQLVLINRADTGAGNFDIEFNYDRVLWETGDASGGFNGVGGVSAAAGYTNGSNVSFELSGSRIPGAFLDSSQIALVRRSANSSVPGRLVFAVRNGTIACTLTIAPINQSFDAAGGTGSITVTGQQGCVWTALSNAPFLTISSGFNGNGDGAINYSVSPNTSATTRTGTITIANQTFTVFQAGALTVSPSILTFNSVSGGAPRSRALEISSGPGIVNWSATASTQNGGDWLGISPSTGTAQSNLSSRATATINVGILPGPGIYQGSILVRSAGSNAVIQVPVAAVVSSSRGGLQLSQSSFVFQAQQGGASPPPAALRVLNNGDSNFSWTIPASAVPSWLNISSLTGISAPGPTGSSITLSPNSAALSTGVYQALLTVSAPGAGNSPQLVSVTLNVVPPLTPPRAVLSQNGFTFSALQGGNIPAPQDLVVSNAGAGGLSITLQPTSAGNWLGIDTGTASTGNGPATVRLSANPAGLASGIYRGRLTLNFSLGSPQEVEVVFVVSAQTAALQRDIPTSAACNAATMDMVASTIGNGAGVTISFPKALLALVVDSCGNPVADASVVVTVEGLNLVLQSLGDGFYSGTWVPQRVSSSLPVTFTAIHATYPTVQHTYTVSTSTAAGGISLPTILTNGVVEGAGFTSQRPIAPGTIVSIFGTQLAPSEAFATDLPLPKGMNGVSVRIGGEDAPLYYVGPTQINAQMPFSVQPGDSVPILVNAGGRLTAPQSYFIAPGQPGVFISGQYAAVLDGQSHQINAANPAALGDVLQIYTTGLGLTNPSVNTGAAAPSFSTVQNPVSVTIGGVNASPIEYQGLAPNFVGLYQVNVRVPMSVTPGDNVSLVVQQNGVPSNPNLPATIPVRAP